MLDMVSEQQKKAINTLIHLQQIGVTEGELNKLIGRWGGLDQSNDYGKLDTELFNIRDVVQQLGSNNPDSVNGNLQQSNNLGSNNGHGGPSMNDFNYIRLHLLKGSTTNMLNRIGITHMPFSLHF